MTLIKNAPGLERSQKNFLVLLSKMYVPTLGWSVPRSSVGMAQPSVLQCQTPPLQSELHAGAVQVASGSTLNYQGRAMCTEQAI